MKKIFIPILILLFSTYHLLFTAELDDILQKMEKTDSEITDLSFSFEQEILIVITNEKSSITGEAVFKKPNLFKIEHIKPEEQTVISDGKKIFFYQKEFNQVMIDDWNSFTTRGGFPDGIFNFSSTISDLKKTYDISLLDDEAKHHVLLLKMKEKQSQDIEIKLWVSKENSIVEKTEMQTETVATTVTISKIKTNKNIKNSVFRFKLPKGAQIITSPF
ncbi:MAG: outer membrane lipoprotein carrier protein LolA [Elusimicrobia bacterium]|nr:outer membrane lipoprotein carrier protein LolA [Elusimicrobiota bacterium]